MNIMNIKWNNANKTLLGAFLCFMAAVVLKIKMPCLFSEGLLFVTEAALVGGVADWFAVTALFEKPLGFPYHTAILPRRREEFIEAVIHLLRREFLSTKSLFALLQQYDWRNFFVNYLENYRQPIKNFLHEKMVSCLSERLSDDMLWSLSQQQAKNLRHQFFSLDAAQLAHELFQNLKQNGKDREFLIAQAKNFHEQLSTSAAKIKIRLTIENYVDEKIQAMGAMASFLSGLAVFFNVIDYDEMAEHLQNELLRVTDDLEKDKDLQEKILKIFYAEIENLPKQKEFLDFVAAAKTKLSQSLPLEEILYRALQNGVAYFNANLKNQESDLCKNFDEYFEKQSQKIFALLFEDAAVQKKIAVLVHDILARCTLYAREVSGVVVQQVLKKLTDEQINEIVYVKVEPDLLWIRMNGSIVGSLIGLALFVLMTLANVSV